VDRALSRDAIVVTSGQLFAALGQIVGVRLLTEFLAPEQYGIAMLFVGGALLAVNLAAGPIGHAIGHFHPALSDTSDARRLVAAAAATLRRTLLLPAIGCAIAGIWLFSLAHSPIALLSWYALIVADGLRTVQLAELNALQKHSQHAAWLCAEGWIKPSLALLAVSFVPSADAVLLGYAAGSILCAVVFANRTTIRDWLTLRKETEDQTDHSDLRKKLWRYVLPLVPLALVTWVSGLGDRYLIGALLTTHDAGVYAAAYGIASRPFQILVAAAELTLRPTYQRSVSQRDWRAAGATMRRWIIAVALVATTACGLIAIFPGFLPDLLLGQNYRAGAGLILPWIACGYGLLCLAQVLERVCYALGRTDLIFLIAVLTAIVSTLAAFVGIRALGLHGVAIAVVVAFGAQLTLAAICARLCLNGRVAANVARPGATAP
jgi:O-antigen/teichoic acid export membrane protein